MEPHPNQLVSCPYNAAHQVEHYRLQFHLTKCQKQYPNLRIVTCPFDATHFIKTEELNHHVATCSKRSMLDTQVYIMDDDHRPQVAVDTAPADFTCDENWDDDNVESYKPDVATANVPMYRKLKGATPSERRKFRYNQSIGFTVNQQQGKSE